MTCWAGGSTCCNITYILTMPVSVPAVYCCTYRHLCNISAPQFCTKPLQADQHCAKLFQHNACSILSLPPSITEQQTSDHKPHFCTTHEGRCSYCQQQLAQLPDYKQTAWPTDRPTDLAPPTICPRRAQAAFRKASN